jgi:hypothetical protein
VERTRYPNGRVDEPDARGKGMHGGADVGRLETSPKGVEFWLKSRAKGNAARHGDAHSAPCNPAAQSLS